MERNLLKRRIRESYRLQKPGLIEFLKKNDVSCELVVQYRGRNIASSKTIDKCLAGALEKLRQQLKLESADNSAVTKSS